MFFNGVTYAHQGCIYLIKIQKNETSDIVNS